ncbi:ribulose bisphosphate carboxylase small chain, chloroplastic-like [Herrania umbratica]|uniref:Ribulose bisphosphate carboxylase small subunit n=1 Tax=Herrania umbratica TaxID=108875 RepID=A0A6J1B1J8_9ROSI|nr:ribulose bisphosphate carboxylase small chain, chloroplastic-like [Herrania umbratica]
MASSMVSKASVGSINRDTTAQASMVAPFTGLKSTSTFPVTRKTKADITSLASNGGRVWPPLGKKKLETLSYLPDLTREQLLKEAEYLLRSKWIPCLEFQLERKSYIFEGKIIAIERQVTLIHSLATAINSDCLISLGNERVASNDREEIVIGWAALSLGWIALNTDGAYRNSFEQVNG